LTSRVVQNYLERVTDSGSKRSERVGELIKQELGRMLLDELKDPRIGFTTVTEVRVTGDLRQARIFVSVYGDQEERERSLSGLKAAAGYVKRELGQRLGLRYTPEILFCQDETLDVAERMDELMRAIAKGETEAPKPHPTQALPVDTDRRELAEIARDFEAAEKAKLALKKRGPKTRRQERHKR